MLDAAFTLFVLFILFFLFFVWRYRPKRDKKDITNTPFSSGQKAEVPLPPSYPMPRHTPAVPKRVAAKEKDDFAWNSFIEDNDISCYNLEPPKPAPASPAVPDPSVRFRHTGKIADFHYHALLTYFPLNNYKTVPQDVLKDRNAVYAFKDGMNWQKVAGSIHDALLNEYPEKHKNWKPTNVVFAIIPSSTRSNTAKRFHCLCERLSDRLGIANGYRAISAKSDRAAFKGQVGINKTANLVYDLSLFKGKYVMLFDDVKTSGESFLQNAQRLKQLGAKDVRGIFLGETYDSRKHGEPSWASPALFEDDLPF